MSAKTPPQGSPRKRPFSLTSLVVIFGLALVLNFVINRFIKPEPKDEGPTGIMLTAERKAPVGKRIEVTLTNTTDQTVQLPADDCPAEPLTVERKDGEAWVPLTATAASARCPVLPASLAPGAKHLVSYSLWNHALFGSPGHYRVSLALAPGSSVSTTAAEFDVTERNPISQAGVTILYQPLYNALIWLISVLPGMSLGFAILVLTFIVRAVLFIPTYRSLAHQTELQALQPELEKIKKQHANDKEKQAQATMALYKERGVNPCGSCLPLIVQLPVLWAMYYVLRDGVDAANQVLLYPGLQHVNIADIQTVFFGMDLLAQHNLIIAIAGAALQFLSMKLIAWSIPAEVRKSQTGGQVATTNAIMTYFLPIFVGYLSYTYPAGLGLYWAASTLFGIGQQVILKRARERQAAKKVGASPVKDAEFREKA